MNKAIFLDRDGVINHEVNYLHKIEEFEFTPKCVEALQKLQSAGYLLFIVTNQAGIGRGYYTESDFEKLNKWMCDKLLSYGVKITGVAYCPHHPEQGLGNYKMKCECRKPEPGMLLPFIEKFRINTESSILVGDKLSDIFAGEKANIGRLILVKSGHKLPDSIPSNVCGVYQNLYEFACSIEVNSGT